jgi:uncharacterized protein
MESVIEKATASVREYMSHYDASHDFTHIQRVLHLAKTIEALELKANPDLQLDGDVITLAALLHDIGDKKYLKPGEDASTLVYTMLQRQGCPNATAAKVQLICTNVSYTNEMKNPAQVAQLCGEVSELRIVQDADRLDAIGASGIARMFVFTGAKQNERGLSVDHFHEKLLHLEKRMKTKTGEAMARKRTERMELFLAWWDEEIGAIGGSKDAQSVLDGYTTWVDGTLGNP